MDKAKLYMISTIVAITGLLIFAGLFLLKNDNKKIYVAINESYNNGTRDGNINTVLYTLYTVAQCNPNGTFIGYNNITAHIVALECYSSG